jgi:hypothetical protein
LGRWARRDFTGDRNRSPDVWSRWMDDLVFVLLTVAFFAVAALVVKGVERL